MKLDTTEQKDFSKTQGNIGSSPLTQVGESFAELH